VEIKLDGREFESVTQVLTARQQDFVTVNLRLSGASEILATNKPSDDVPTRASKAEAVVNRILESGRKYKLLAGLLTEKGKTWKREDAERNAEIFAESRDLDEQKRMNEHLLDFVLVFFRFGEVSSTTSPTFSTPTAKDPDTSSAEQPTSEISAP
jgi:hypothetical protein